MKATDYISAYHERLAASDETSALAWLFTALHQDALRIALERSGGRTQAPDRVALPVLREFDLKWRAIARALDLNPNGWRDWWLSKGVRL